MPVETKSFFRPDVLRSHLAGYRLPAVDSAKLKHSADLITTGRLRDLVNEAYGLTPDEVALL